MTNSAFAGTPRAYKNRGDLFPVALIELLGSSLYSVFILNGLIVLLD
jgi:hypothetical protein